MKITVTNDDIDQGRKRDPNNCAVALALRRAGVAHFGVTGMLVCIAEGPASVMLPANVQEWIMEFDRGLTVGPIEFELSLPDSMEKKHKALRANKPAEAQPSAGRPESKPLRIPVAGAPSHFLPSVRIPKNGGRRAKGKHSNTRWDSDVIVTTE